MPGKNGREKIGRMLHGKLEWAYSLDAERTEALADMLLEALMELFSVPGCHILESMAEGETQLRDLLDDMELAEKEQDLELLEAAARAFSFIALGNSSVDIMVAEKFEKAGCLGRKRGISGETAASGDGRWWGNLEEDELEPVLEFMDNVLCAKDGNRKNPVWKDRGSQHQTLCGVQTGILYYTYRMENGRITPEEKRTDLADLGILADGEVVWLGQEFARTKHTGTDILEVSVIIRTGGRTGVNEQIRRISVETPKCEGSWHAGIVLDERQCAWLVLAAGGEWYRGSPPVFQADTETAGQTQKGGLYNGSSDSFHSSGDFSICSPS
ncbi:MAG: hypothetical protein LUF27_11820 [Lachnospiraceae bacterium]|nr:hypothetical protein [Lachnospiraceae bacterium]